jgi:hypothetical protein
MMKRIVLTLLAVGLVVVNDAVTWANAAMKGCPGKCPFCP